MRKTSILLILLSTCISVVTAGVEQPATRTISKPKPPELRLDDRAEPIHYSVELTILPEKDTFTGRVTIDINVARSTSLPWLNATDLKIQKVNLLSKNGIRQGRVAVSNEDLIGLSWGEPLRPGKNSIYIAYTGTLSTIEETGIFKQKENDEWYVFSDFEAIDARRAFPCFDEPSYKAPWQLTLHMKKEHLAFSNTPVETETGEPNGMKRVVFAQTKPLPSYLVALAVGPFQAVDAGKAGRNETPLRIITPGGMGKQARYAAEVTPQLVTLLEDYFNIPFPYEKLDQIAIPSFGGAMENAGLITWWQHGLLAKPEEETIYWKRTYATFAAHEIAHQWLGDLVTMSWWDDIWLNESFASWMETKIVDQWKPEWDLEVSRVKSRSSAMESDSLISARKIRQPIESKDDIENAFDAITYGKGEAILEMFETWVGEEKFRKGVQKYLSEHAWGNATANDFLQSLSAVAGPDVAPAISTFLDQGGVPLVTVEYQCSAEPGSHLILTQERYLPIGSQGQSRQLWQIPVCVEYGVNHTENQQCSLMKSDQMTLRLDTQACPDWVLPNLGEAGYYRVGYRGDLLTRLLKNGGRQLSIPERVGLMSDLRALAENGAMPSGDLLGMVPTFLTDPNPHIVSATINLLNGMSDKLVADEVRPNYQRFIREMYGDKAREIEWAPKPEESNPIRLLRLIIMDLVASQGEDAELQEQATELAKHWLTDRNSIDADLTAIVLSIAARHADRSLFERYLEEAKKTLDRNDRENLFAALGSFLNPEIEKEALSLILSDLFDPKDSIRILYWAVFDRQTRDVAYEWMKTNFDALVKRLPREYQAYLPRFANDFCDENHKADVQRFFGDRANKFTGGRRNLARTLEEIGLCISLREAQEPSVTTLLKKY